MTIGIVGAMPKEIALLSKDLKNVRQETRVCGITVKGRFTAEI